MACFGIKGGYSKIVYGTTVGMTTSTEITQLLNGTRILDGSVSSIEDAAGQLIHTGVTQPGEVHTALVTGSVITALNTAAECSTPLWFRYYSVDGNYIKVGGTYGCRITMSFRGAGPGELHRNVIQHTVFDAASNDVIEINT